VPIYLNVCSECVHYSGARACSAFPARIPDNVWRGDSPHTARSPLQVGDDVLAVRDEAGRAYLVEIGRLSAGEGELAQG